MASRCASTLWTYRRDNAPPTFRATLCEGEWTFVGWSIGCQKLILTANDHRREPDIMDDTEYPVNEPQIKTDAASWHEIDIRVRYSDCDPMRVAHHSVYPIWLEIARTELLRTIGNPYEQIERQGVLFVVAKLSIRYSGPRSMIKSFVCGPRNVTAGSSTRSKSITNTKSAMKSELIATASTTLVCVDRQGKPQVIPEVYLEPRRVIGIPWH